LEWIIVLHIKAKTIKLLDENRGEYLCGLKTGIDFFFFYSYVHTMLGSFLPPTPIPSFTTHSPFHTSPTPSIPGRNYFALISNFVEERV
jgi:hypothetical protein